MGPQRRDFITTFCRRAPAQAARQTAPGFYILVFLLVVGFTFFYTLVVFQQQNLAENLQKQGGFVPGIRPGRPTGEYIMRVLVRITWAGALFLGFVAVLPYLVTNWFNVTVADHQQHRPAHRRRCRAGHDEAARGAAADAQLRGVHPLDVRHLLRPSRRRQGHAGGDHRRAHGLGAHLDRRHAARARRRTARSSACKAKAYMDQGLLVPDDLVDRHVPGRGWRELGRRTRASCSTASRARSPRRRRSTRRSRSSGQVDRRRRCNITGAGRRRCIDRDAEARAKDSGARATTRRRRSADALEVQKPPAELLDALPRRPGKLKDVDGVPEIAGRARTRSLKRAGRRAGAASRK